MAGTESSLKVIEEEAARVALNADVFKETGHNIRALAEMIEGLAQEVQLLKEGRTI